jgi:GT2 family glycosyltransferase
MTEKVIISILDYNQEKDTLSCLHSLDQLATDDFEIEIIVVDNYPKVTFSLGKEKFHHPITILKTDENKGFSGGHNIGIKKALTMGADYVVVLNNDTRVDKNLIKELVKASRDDKKRGAIVPKIYFEKGHEYHRDRYKSHELGKVIWYAGGKMDWDNINGSHRGVDEVDTGQYDTPSPTGLITGCCVLFPRNVLEKTKGFDDRYFLYYEDADLNERIKKFGFTIWYQPTAMLWHINAGATGGSGSVLQDYFISRNRMLFGMQYARLRTKIALLRESFTILKKGREWQKKGIKDYYKGKFGRGSYPV